MKGFTFIRLLLANARRSCKGFTFIELILVLAILMTVLFFSVPFYSRFLLQNAVLNTTDQMVGSLRKAAMYSMMGKQNSGWSVNYDTVTKKIVLYLGSNYVGRNTAFDEVYNINPNVSVTGSTNVSFAKITGLPTTTATITISASTNTRTIIVNSQGMVTR